MEISVIASGSNGNCCLIETKDASILIDAGKSGREIEARINRLGKNLENINAILLTHSHSDHRSGAGVIARKYNIPVYMTKEVFSDVKYAIGDIERKSFTINKEFKVHNLKIMPIPTSHNVSSNGFVIKNFGVFTDTGKVTKQMEDIFPKLKGVLLESNHDVDMVINGSYPHFLKSWILSDEGHLSNIHASELIQNKGTSLNLALLGHLSENNNTPEKALETFRALVKRKLDYSVCSRYQESGTWEI